YTASCHFHHRDKRKLGIIEMDFSLARVDTAIWNKTVKTILAGVIFFFIISLSLSIILWRLVSRPVSMLAESMKKVSEGDMEHPVYIHSNDEIGMLARTFNEMIRELKRYRDTMNEWTKKLEEEVAKKTEEIKATQRSLMQAEKLASLGRMAAGVAHELNNPLTGIITFANLMLQRIPEENKEDREDLEVIIEQAQRCAEIVKGLLTFSRATKTTKGIINLEDVLNKTLDMVKRNEKFYHIKIDVKRSEKPLLVEGDASQFQQVFLNLLINAADAMNGRGKVTIESRVVEENDRLMGEMVFTDTGPGIAEENIGKIFDPFFTTKPVGKGTGLGLAVSHGIIKHHGGSITVKSKLGEGASFIIRVPLVSNQSH
ncbi:MAG: HAMP domain-containing protein, partial [Nitrospirae bacterium]